MAAIPGQLDAPTAKLSRRAKVRRKLHLEARGSTASDQTGVLILDISTSGLLLQTTAELALGDTIEVQLPGSDPASALVKWSSGPLFGCQFAEPVSNAFVSAALLRSRPQLAMPGLVFPPDSEQVYTEDLERTGKLSGVARIAVLVGLTIVLWAVIAVALLAL